VFSRYAGASRIPAGSGVVLQPRGFAPDWILPGTAEDYWQNNKFLIVKPDFAKGAVVEDNNQLFPTILPLLFKPVSGSLDP
jgi:hypothetical protein